MQTCDVLIESLENNEAIGQNACSLNLYIYISDT